MERALLAASAEFTLFRRNWNAEFQTVWELDDITEAQAAWRQQKIYRVEKEFEAEAMVTVKQIVTLGDGGPRELPKFPQCFRVDNIFFRVLPDSRSGRNYVSSLRGVLQSGTRLLTVPLSCMFFYRGMPVLAQALVPMSQQPTRLYGAGSTNDPEIGDMIQLMMDSLNIPILKDIICEVYEGLDGRAYCFSTNVTTIPVSRRLPAGYALKRQELLALCTHVSNRAEDIFAVLQSPSVLNALAQIGQDEQSQLCDTLHYYGVNLCFLRDVLRIFATHRGSQRESMEALESCVVVEMIARTIKQEFYLEVQSKRVAYDEVMLRTLILRYIGFAFDTKNYTTIFLPALLRKYAISRDDAQFIRLLDHTRCSCRRHIIARLSVLIGARLSSSENNAPSNGYNECLSPPSSRIEAADIHWLITAQARVVPRLLDPKKKTVFALASQYETLRTAEGHTNAFCVPLRIKVAVWERRYDAALCLARQAVLAQRAKYGAASLAHSYAIRTLCELLFSGGAMEFIEEGCLALEPMLRGFALRAGPVTRARRHIECGCWMLGCSDVVDMTSAALLHFKAAEKIVPRESRGAHGAWLYIQPRLGMIRCRQSRRIPKEATDMEALAVDARSLANSVLPVDIFVEYLWEIGMELKKDKLYAQSSETLLAALNMGRKVSGTDLDLGALTRDVVGVYCAWDPKKYASYCEALLADMTVNSKF